MIDEKSANEAREQILGFIRELLNLLEKIIHKPYTDDGQRLVLEEMERELLEAWKEFSEDFDRNEVESRISETSQESLQSHGLYGIQLRAKLSLFRSRVDRFFANMGAKTLLKLIYAGDTVLDSILAATAITEAIKEINHLMLQS